MMYTPATLCTFLLTVIYLSSSCEFLQALYLMIFSSETMRELYGYTSTVPYCHPLVPKDKMYKNKSTHITRKLRSSIRTKLTATISQLIERLVWWVKLGQIRPATNTSSTVHYLHDSHLLKPTTQPSLHRLVRSSSRASLGLWFSGIILP
ncbi:hypothetical protein HD806DRAFT_371793 [Xylariaceae sp. AK1471]|nr:hypothetical protein HD806DRAFT_371793 [Xylariaceae sp. AK1471]